MEKQFHRSKHPEGYKVPLLSNRDQGVAKIQDIGTIELSQRILNPTKENVKT